MTSRGFFLGLAACLAIASGTATSGKSMPVEAARRYLRYLRYEYDDSIPSGAPIYLENIIGKEQTRLGYNPTSRMAYIGPADATQFVYRQDMLLEAYDTSTKKPTGECLEIHSDYEVDFQECDVDELGQHWLFTHIPSPDSAYYYMIVSQWYEEALQYSSDTEDKGNPTNLTVIDLYETFGKSETLFLIENEDFFSGTEVVHGTAVYLENIVGMEQTRLGYNPTSRIASIGPTDATQVIYRVDMLLEVYDTSTQKPTGDCLEIHSDYEVDFQECDVDEVGQRWLFTRVPSQESPDLYTIGSQWYEEVLQYNNDVEDEDNLTNLTVTDFYKTSENPETLFHIGDKSFFGQTGEKE